MQSADLRNRLVHQGEDKLPGRESAETTGHLPGRDSRGDTEVSPLGMQVMGEGKKIKV